MLAHDLLDTWIHLSSPVHRLDARVKLVCACILVAALLATPVARPGLLGAWAAVLLALAAASRLPAGWIAARLVPLVPFLVLGTVALPFVPVADGGRVWQVAGLTIPEPAALLWLNFGGKCLLTLLAATLLTGTTASAELLRAAAALGLPRSLTALVGFALTYLTVLGAEGGRMITARRARGRVPGLGRNLRVGASMAATLMARTVERGERVALAMVARGYRGHVPGLQPGPAPAGQVALGAVFVAVCAGILWAGMRA